MWELVPTQGTTISPGTYESRLFFVFCKDPYVGVSPHFSADHNQPWDI